MPKYVITRTESYEVEADDPRTALNHFHIFFDNAYLSDFNMETLTLEQDNFELLDGTDTIEEKEE
jgi:hypothetical protein